MTFRVLVSDLVSEEGLARLRGFDDVEVDAPGAMEREAFLAALPGHHALIVRSGTRVDAEALARAVGLKVV